MKQVIVALLMLLAMNASAQLTPVRLTKFVVQKTNTGINAVWTTATESNNSYFEVQGSVDGINFTSLGKVNAYTSTGDSFSPHDYSLAVTFPKQAGFGIVFMFIMTGLAMVCVRKTGKPLALLFVLGSFAACSKSSDSAAPAKDKTPYSIYRLAQVDKDGGTAYFGQTN